MIPVVGLGAGGHAKVVIEILRSQEKYEFVGLLDSRRELWSTEVLGVRVLGPDDLLGELYARGVRSAFIGVGSVGNSTARQRLYERLVREGFQVVSAVDPHSVVAPSASMGRGVIVMPGAVINAAARVGDNVIINTGAIIEHDCVVGHHAHIAPGVCLAGGVCVGEGAHVGLGASVCQGLTIGARAVVGAGAVVLEDVPERTVVAGVPARILRAVDGP